MLPILLITNLGVWGYIIRENRRDKRILDQLLPGKHHPLYDPDMVSLWEAKDPQPIAKSYYDESYEDWGIMDFEKWVETQRKRNKISEVLWEEAMIDIPVSYVWANGYALEVGNPSDLKKFEEIKDQAILKQVYCDMPFPEGEQKLMEHWFLLLGFSLDGAKLALEIGLKPWEVEWNW